MKKVLLLAILSAQFSYAQQSTVTTLDSCISWAKQHYPLLKQNGLLTDMSQTNINALNENWMPKLSFSAQGVYQTEVVQFNIPGFNYHFPHDSYLGTVSLEQSIFDGGQTREQKNIEHLNTAAEVQKNEVELYKLVDRINQLYVSILLTRENINVLNVYKDDIDNRRKNLSAGQQNGLVLQSSLDELEAESLKTDQSLIESKDNLDALYRTLQFFTDHPITEATVFATTPIGGTTNGGGINRPELKLFSIQEEMLSSRYKLTNDYALPKVSFNAAGNYGRPGPNFINQQLRFFGSAGVSVKWNISSLYGLSREKKKYNLNQEMVDIQREVFLFNLNTTLTTQTAQINSLQEMIEKDKTIVEKRHSVTTTSSAQLENGKITVTDYLTQLNAELQATLNQKIHEIKLMNAQTSYNTTKGINF